MENTEMEDGLGMMVAVWNINRFFFFYCVGGQIGKITTELWFCIPCTPEIWELEGIQNVKLGEKVCQRRTFEVLFIIDSCFLLIWKPGLVDLYRKCSVSTADYSCIFTSVFWAPNREMTTSGSARHLRAHISCFELTTN